MSETRVVFKTGVSSVIYSNTGKLIKGNTVRDKFLVMADSVLFIDSDSNVAGGYLGIHPSNMNVDISFIKSTSPSGKFLKDNGTWDTLTASTHTSSFIFASGQGIDTSATASADILNIGVTNANVINYGNSSTQHNFFGTAIYEQQVNSFVTDKLITLNNGGGAASGIGVGFEVIENGAITGYFKTNGERNGYSLKSPAIEFIADISTGSLTANRSFSFPNSSGAFLVGSVGDAMIAYGSSGTLTGSSNLLWNGSMFRVNGNSFLGGTTDPTAWLHIAAGSTSKAPLRLTSGALKTSAEIGALEFLTDRLYFTKTTGSTRETIAFLSDITSVSVSDGMIAYGSAGSLTGSSNFSWNGSVFRVNGNSFLGGTNDPTAWLHLAAGSTSKAPLRLTSGALRSSTEIGALEFLTDRLYFTKTTGSTRETIAFLSDISSGATPGGSDYNIQYGLGGVFEGSDQFIWDNSSQYFKVDGASSFGLATSNDPTAFVDVSGANDSQASLRIRPTDGTSGPASPNSGDIWQDGDFIYIQLNSGTFRFMLEPA